MVEKNIKTIIETLAEKIEELKFEVYLKDLRIKELENQLSEKEGEASESD